MLIKCDYCGEECIGKLQMALKKNGPTSKFCKQCFAYLVDKPMDEVKKLIKKYNGTKDI